MATARPEVMHPTTVARRGSVATTALTITTLLLTVVSLGMIVFYAPMERVQGVVQRIYYFHVPMAWVAYMAFFVVLVASVMYLWKRDMKWDTIARASVEVGVVFTTLVLITGMLWGKPIWNTYWTWDARLTSTLVLWFIYVAYIMLRSYTPDRERAARLGAVLGIVGFVDVPIIHFSVTWWRTLHPLAVVAPTLERSTPNAPPQTVITLLVCLLTMTLAYGTFMVYRTGLARLRDENRELEELATH
jgi:heme exporter protein C